MTESRDDARPVPEGAEPVTGDTGGTAGDTPGRRPEGAAGGVGADTTYREAAGPEGNDARPDQFVGRQQDSNLGAERGAQPHRPTTGSVGGGTESDRAGEGTAATPGLSGAKDSERLAEERER